MHISMNMSLPIYRTTLGCPTQLTVLWLDDKFFDHVKPISHFNLMHIFFSDDKKEKKCRNRTKMRWALHLIVGMMKSNVVGLQDQKLVTVLAVGI